MPLRTMSEHVSPPRDVQSKKTTKGKDTKTEERYRLTVTVAPLKTESQSEKSAYFTPLQGKRKKRKDCRYTRGSSGVKHIDPNLQSIADSNTFRPLATCSLKNYQRNRRRYQRYVSVDPSKRPEKRIFHATTEKKEKKSAPLPTMVS